MPDDPAAILNYASRKKARGWRRWALVVVAVGVAAGIYWRGAIGGFFREHANTFSVYLVERRCRHWQSPPDRLVFSELASDAKAFPANGPGNVSTATCIDSSPTWGPPDRSSTPPPLHPAFGWSPGVTDAIPAGILNQSEFDVAVDPQQGQGPVVNFCGFVHELISPGGHRRLVWVEGKTGINASPILIPSVWIPSTPWTLGHMAVAPANPTSASDSTVNSLWLIRGQPSDRIRLFAGQIDPTDPSRFTITGQYNSTPFTISGQLDDDDQVVLSCDRGWEFRDPPVAGRSARMIASGATQLVSAPAAHRHIAVPISKDWHNPQKIVVSPDGTSVFVVFDNGISGIDLASGQPRWHISGDQEDVYDISPDGEYAAMRTVQAEIVVEDTQTKRVLLSAGVGTDHVAFRADGDIVAAITPGARGSSGSDICCWEAPSFKPLPVIHLRGYGEAMAAGADGGMWAATTKDEIAMSPMSLERFGANGQPLGPTAALPHWGLVPNLLPSYPNRWLVVWYAAEGFPMLLFDQETGKLITYQTFPIAIPVLNGYDRSTLAAAATPNRLAVWSDSGSLAVVDLPGFSRFEELCPHVSGVAAMTFSRDGKSLITASSSPGLDVWELPGDAAVQK